MLDGFRGDPAFIHKFEAHVGRPYVIRGSRYSGVTLDTGLDLGQADPKLFEQFYTPILTGSQVRLLRGAIGLTGDAGRRYFAQNEDAMKQIRISHEMANRIFPYVLDQYWKVLVRRVPSVVDAPPPVQTVLLSIAYNRGPYNKCFSGVDAMIQGKAWKRLGAYVAAMQQDHKLRGIRTRRSLEGHTILEYANRTGG